MEHPSIPYVHNTFNSIVSYIYLLDTVISDIGMSYGTSDTTVISSTKTEARNLNTTIASAAQRGDSSPATIPANIAENRQVH